MAERKPFLDPDDPFFAKAWVRWAVTLFPLAWGGVEVFLGNPGWGILFLALGAYAGTKLILRR